MRFLFVPIILLLGAFGSAANANTDELPGDAQWYLHVDLDTMRDSAVGRELYAWLDREVFSDLKEDADFDVNEELDSLVAYSGSRGHATAVFSGNIRQASKDKLLAAMAASGDLQLNKQNGVSYYQVDDLDMQNAELQIDQETLFFSFERSNTLVLSTQLEDLVAAVRGKRTKRDKDKRALLVLTAERSLLQAGLDATALGEDGNNHWNSGLLRQANQLAFVLSERKGNADLLLRITADDQETTDSLAAVVRGLIGLYALSGDDNQQFASLLNKLSVDADNKGLSLQLIVPANTLLNIIE